jgi:hypothetical protein
LLDYHSVQAPAVGSDLQLVFAASEVLDGALVPMNRTRTYSDR